MKFYIKFYWCSSRLYYIVPSKGQYQYITDIILYIKCFFRNHSLRFLSQRTEIHYIYHDSNGKIFQPKTNFTKAKWKRSVEKTQRPKTIIYYEKVGSNITQINLFFIGMTFEIFIWKSVNWCSKNRTLSIIKWGSSSRWSSSLYCHMRNSDGMTIRKTHPILQLNPNILYIQIVLNK